MSQMPGPTGEILLGHVRTYARFAQQRTGSAEAAATLDWLEGEMRAMGAASSRWRYEFPRYDFEAHVSIDGRPVDCLPLFHEFVGDAHSTAPFARAIVLANNYDKSELNGVLLEARQARATLAVLATIGQFGARRIPALIGVNVDPDTPKSGIATLLVSGALANALKSGRIDAGLRAASTPDSGENLLARLGNHGTPPILITTPLTGWFACAAERGSGIAVSIELARQFSRHHDVVLLATTGHELENLGLRRHLAAGLGFAPRAVIHIGASLAACAPGPSGRLELWPGRVAASTVAMAGAFGDALLGAGFTPSPRFFGEGQHWHAHLPNATPLLSFAGTFPAFHTPSDLPAATTTAEALEKVFRAVSAAIAAMLTR